MSTGGISLDLYFKKMPFPAFPHLVSPMGWSFYNLKDLTINSFGNFRMADLHQNLKAYIGAPDYTEEEIQAYINNAIKGIYYVNKDNDNEYDKETEAKLADIRLFISLDGAFLLKAYHALKNNIKKDEIAIFLEIPDQDIVSGNVMAVAAGENARKYAEEILQHEWTQDQYTLNEAQIKDLISALNTGQSLWDRVNAVVIDIKHLAKDLKSELIINIAGGLSKFFSESLRVDEKKWNIDDPDYFLKNDVVETLKEKYREANVFFDNIGLDSEYRKILNAFLENGIRKIEHKEIYGQEHWALYCGLWNGLTDLITGLFDLIQLLNKGIKAHSNYKRNEDYYKTLVLEYIDNLLQAAVEISWEEVLNNGLKKYHDFKVYASERLSLEYWQELLNFNHTEIAYYRGYLTFNILEAVIPPIKLAKLAKAGKLEKILSLLDGLTSAAKTGVPVVKASDEVVGAFFKTIEQGTDILKGGTKNVNKLIDDIFDALKKQVDEVVEKTSPDDLKRIANKKRLQQQEDFIKKWKGKSIKALTKTEIADALKGFTEQGNKIAKLIEEGGMKFKILDDTEFNKILMDSGDTLKEARATAAFNIGDRNYFRSSKPVEEFLSELVHEGTHTLDNLIADQMKKQGASEAEIIKRMGDNLSYEKRAYFHERAWQEATGASKDFDTIENMLKHIFRHYDKI